ncbi:MAG: hypothetical protein KJ060_17430, partial [Candidatus Hydrogenedentes bacterium]|nr:hypothetical protein [Candidatus Hydrogenedentota bacterium]
TRSAIDLKVNIPDVQLADNATVWRIAGPDRMAYNDPGSDPVVAIEEESLSGLAGSLPVSPLSVSIFRIETD